jgi:hypothetical protein
MVNDAISYWTPHNFNPEMSSADASRVPQAVRVSRNLVTYPSGSPNNPGYAYGTFIPQTDRGMGLVRFMSPYTVPVGATALNTIPLTYKNDVQWINPTRQLRIKGLTTEIPGIDTSQLDAIQAYLGNAQG